MGQIKELSCKCGYKKKLFTGAGLMSIKETAVRKTFTAEELRYFDSAKQNGILKSFMIENVKAYCPRCNEILALPTLKYKAGSIEKVIGKSCPECGAKTTEALNCPKCGEPLTEKEAGHWD